jgi:hypothetical protein
VLKTLYDCNIMNMWCLYYKWVIALALALASVLNYDRKWCS